MDVKFLVAGDRAVSVEFGKEICLEVNTKVRMLEEKLKESPIEGVVEVVPTYCSLIVHYRPEVVRYDGLVEALKDRLEHMQAVAVGKKIVKEVPVLYGGETGPDLEYCAQLENILALMERYPWFQVCLDEGEREGYTLHIFEEQDVYLFKEEPPYIIFRIREPNTVAAFWDYMQRTVEDLRQERPAVCRRIREHMEQIRRAMEDRGIQFM